jgi:hypothetical protein
MVLFPFMTTWMWFQILTASPIPSWGGPLAKIAASTFRHGARHAKEDET